MQRRAKPPERALPGQACHLQQPGQHRIVGHKAEMMETGEPDIDGQHHRHHELIDAHATRPAFHRQHFLHQLLELQLLQQGGHREKSAVGSQIPAVKVEWSRTRDFTGFRNNSWRALLGAGLAAMLLFVLHLLGDLLEIGSRSAHFAASLFYNRVSRVPKGFSSLRASSAPQTLCIGRVTAVGAAFLSDQGRLDLDAPVQKYVPQFPDKEYVITTRELLGHLGGIRTYTREEESKPLCEVYHSVSESLKRFKDDPLSVPPGTKWLYSTYGYVLASAVIEGASGQDFLTFMHDKVFLPTGMK